jgi:hypothetical protein
LMFTKRRRVNVSAVERRVSLAAGDALAVYALRRSLGHLLLLGLGGYLVYRGTTGNCQVYQALGLSTAFDEEVPSAPKAPDSPPGGPLGLVAAGLLKGVTEQQVREELRRFKEVLETGRPHALRTAILACRKGGTVSVAGVFGGFIDKVPFGAAMNKGLTFRMGQTHVHKYLRPLLDRIQRGEIDPSFVVTHRLGIEQAPYAYEIFKHKEDGCVKAVLDPWQ